jgi:LPS-assembly protein
LHAQQPEPSPRLKPTPQLREDLGTDPNALPTFIEGDAIRGRTDFETSIEGSAQLRRGDTVIRADKLQYNQPDDLARAAGNVRINKAGNVYEGPLLELKVDAFEGFFSQPSYRFLRNGAYGEAERVDFIDDKRSVIRNATYTTCRALPGAELDAGLDPARRQPHAGPGNRDRPGRRRGAQFFGVPILPVPNMSFPLSTSARAACCRPPSASTTSAALEYTQPYYWNIAPNRDATLYPTLMTKRGIDLGGEFRYLEPDYNGRCAATTCPATSCATGPLGLRAASTTSLRPGPAIGGGGLNLNVNRVSDDNYWRDFSRSSSSLTQRLLAGDANFNWAYRRLHLHGPRAALAGAAGPGLAHRAALRPGAAVQREAWAPRKLWGGLEARVETDFSRFNRSGHVRTAFSATVPEVSQPDADRTYALAQISRPWRAPGWFVVPKAQLHATRYDFDAGRWPTARPRRPHRADLQPGQRGWCSSAAPATSAAPSPRRWSRAPSTSTRRSATRISCRTTTRR